MKQSLIDNGITVNFVSMSSNMTTQVFLIFTIFNIKNLAPRLSIKCKGKK